MQVFYILRCCKSYSQELVGSVCNTWIGLGKVEVFESWDHKERKVYLLVFYPLILFVLSLTTNLCCITILVYT
jgi:hypothetical protein